MLSHLARRSLGVTSRGYHIARTLSLAVNVTPCQVSKSALLRCARPVSASCFRFSTDSSGGATTPGVVDITHEDVERSLQQNEAVIIDVRNFDEAATLGQIPTSNVLPVDDIEAAMHLSADEFQTKYGFVKPVPSGRPLIVYCMRGVRATQAAITFAEQFGFTSVLIYKGSWVDWSERHPEHVKQSPATTTDAKK